MRALVVGNGPIGSSVARSLADRGVACTVVGPSGGGLCSHDDMGRIARVADAEGSTLWAERNKTSIALYRDLEARSGVRFYHECGSLCVGDDTFVAPIRESLETAAARYECLGTQALRERFPYLRILDGQCGVWEPEAGYVNPHEMVHANNALTKQAGGRNPLFILLCAKAT